MCGLSRIILIVVFVLLILIAIVLSIAVHDTCLRAAFFGGATRRRASKTVDVDRLVADTQEKALERYSTYRAEKPVSFEEFCYPKSYAVQKQQLFAGEFMEPKSGHSSLLVFHKIGAGKTCLAIQVGEKWKSRGRPLMIMPASLIPGFRNELRSKCAGDAYISDAERATLTGLTPGSDEYLEIIRASDARIDAAYQVYSYNGFAQLMTEGSPPVAPITIVDEVQNVTNPHGVFFQSLLTYVGAGREPIVLMTGTPVFDMPKELVSIARLMRIKLPDGILSGARALLPEEVERYFNGKVSYFAGAPKYTFPDVTVEVTQVPMGRFQARWYSSEVETERTRSGGIQQWDAPNNFYIRSRQRANIVYPSGLTGDQGLGALTPAMIRGSLELYSAKFAKLIPRLDDGELAFVYTAFTGAGGIEAVTKCLRAFGWEDFAVAGPGKRRYAIWSGEQTGGEKDLVRATFNSSANDDGSQIQVVIGSPAIKEGVSLLRVRRVHVLEGYWNWSRLEQIFGRADRYCSHKTLDLKDRNVAIFIYAAVAKKTPAGKAVTPEASIDLYILAMADMKRAKAEPYIDALMHCAVDRLLHYGAGA